MKWGYVEWFRGESNTFDKIYWHSLQGIRRHQDHIMIIVTILIVNREIDMAMPILYCAGGVNLMHKHNDVQLDLLNFKIK
jgi:hypothetical protein